MDKTQYRAMGLPVRKLVKGSYVHYATLRKGEVAVCLEPEEQQNVCFARIIPKGQHWISGAVLYIIKPRMPHGVEVTGAENLSEIEVLRQMGQMIYKLHQEQGSWRIAIPSFIVYVLFTEQADGSYLFVPEIGTYEGQPAILLQNPPAVG